MKTVLYGGHLSRFGRACIKAILENQYFQIDCIVLADATRWITFYQALKKGQQPINEKKIRRNYKKQTLALKKIAAEKNVHIREISTANGLEETAFVKQYDLVLSAAFPEIFSEAFIQAPRRGAINFHPSYLPRCRGANPIYWTIASGEDFGGVTCHFMTGKLDQGPIVVQEKILFEKHKITFEQLYQKVIDQLPALMIGLEAFFTNNQETIFQDHSKASYFTENLAKDHRINWPEDTYEKADAKIRAGNAFTTYKDLRIRLIPFTAFFNELPTEAKSLSEGEKPGTLLFFDRHHLIIKVKDGYLKAPYYLQITGVSWLQKLKLYPLIQKYFIHQNKLNPGIILQ